MVSKPSPPEAIEPLQKDQKPRRLISHSHPHPKGRGFQVVKLTTKRKINLIDAN
jgi:hypothetical protein